MKVLRKLLLPFSALYFVITWLRNIFFDNGWLQSKSYALPVIAIGNLNVGGTGKTPMTEYMIKLLKDRFRVAVLSRGYGRSTKGYLLADALSDAKLIGDEPFQFYKNYGNELLVAVSESRQIGIERLLALKNKPEVILLDDAFQHRKVMAGFYVLLTAYNDLYVDDFLLPAGNLRESKIGAKRANIIIVTKCPNDLTKDEKELIKTRLKLTQNQQLFFSYIAYSDTIKNETESKSVNWLQNQKFTLVTGIANAKPLVTHLKSLNLNFEHLDYKDHHVFSDNDISELKKSAIVVTTEKDFVRLEDRLVQNLYYIPIETKIDSPNIFNESILDFVNTFMR